MKEPFTFAAMLSDCCRAGLHIVDEDEGTAYYVCLNCFYPCDQEPVKMTATAGERLKEGNLVFIGKDGKAYKAVRPWWKKEAPEKLSIISIAVLAFMTVMTVGMAMVKLGGEAHFVVSPQVDELAAFKARSIQCAVQVSLEASVVDSRYWSKEIAGKSFNYCMGRE